jgi:hypothetical protein
MSRDDSVKRGACILALAGAVALSAQGQAALPAAKPISPLAWLVGGVWTSDVTPPGGHPTRIETRYQWADNSAYVRFTTHFVSEKGTFKNYDGSFFWNPEQSTLAMWYMDAGGTITQGPVTMTADTMLMTFRGTDFDGKLADMRVTVTRKNADAYRWQLEEKQPSAWKPLLSLEYRRTAGS